MNLRRLLTVHALITFAAGVAFLSFAGRNLRQPDAVRLVTLTMIVFHGCTAVVEVYT